VPLNPSPQPLPSSGALVDGIFQVLVDAIVAGDLAPGEVVRESEVGDLLGVSRTPVREAFRKLAEVDLLRILVNRGSTVADVDADHLTQISQVLAELAGLAGRLALPLLSTNDVAWIENLSEHQLRVALGEAAEEYRLYGIELLDLLISRADNPVLAKMIAALRPHIHRLINLHRERLTNLELAQELAAIATVIRERQAELLQATVRSYYVLLVDQLLDESRSPGSIDATDS